MSKPDPKSALRAAIDAGPPSPLKVDQLFGDDPELLALIREAAAAQVPASKIAELISAPGKTVSDKAIKRWLAAQ